MNHQITLSNGPSLLIEEGNNKITLATVLDGDVDAYICQCDRNGVLVYPNSGDAIEFLTQGLKDSFA